jgi:LysR family transcriptional regulator, nitrogen assimilation regulatory protein
MEIRRLEYFVATAELGSLGRASEILRIAQPALTRQVRLLEEELGVTLFTRTSRGMRLTEVGDELLAAVVGPLRQLRGSLDNIRTFSSTLAGNVAIGLPPTVAEFLGGPLLERITMQEPKISPRIVEGTSQHLSDWLFKSELDMVVLYAPVEDEKFVTRELMTEEMVLIGGPESGLSADREMSFEDVMALPLILPNPRNGLRRISEKLACKFGAELQVKYVVDSQPVLKDMVGKGLGYTILPRSSVTSELALGLLRFAPIKRPMTRTLLLATNPYARGPRIIARIDQILQEVLVELESTGRITAKVTKRPVRLKGG